MMPAMIAARSRLHGRGRPRISATSSLPDIGRIQPTSSLAPAPSRPTTPPTPPHPHRHDAHPLPRSRARRHRRRRHPARRHERDQRRAERLGVHEGVLIAEGCYYQQDWWCCAKLIGMAMSDELDTAKDNMTSTAAPAMNDANATTATKSGCSGTNINKRISSYSSSNVASCNAGSIVSPIRVDSAQFSMTWRSLNKDTVKVSYGWCPGSTCSGTYRSSGCTGAASAARRVPTSSRASPRRRATPSSRLRLRR